MSNIKITKQRLIIDLQSELEIMLKEQELLVEDSVQYVITQIKIICHNLLFKIYSNDVFLDMIKPPAIENSISEIIKKVCFTTEYDIVQIFVSNYQMAEVIALNLADILKTSETVDKNCPIEISVQDEIACIDLFLKNSRISTFKDYKKGKEVVYSI